MTEESIEPEVLERQEACDDSLKDMEETIYQLRANRKIRLALLTRQMNIVKGLLDDDVNILEVRQSMVKYRKLLDEIKDAHKSFQHLLSEEERRIDLEKWFQPKMDAIQDFMSCVTAWLSSTAVTKDVEVDAPADNVSVVSFRSKESTQSSHSSRRSYSSRSSHSSHLSALIEAEAERAALKARYAALKEKHALEEKEQKLNLQKEQIRKQKETLEIESELAATTARINILKEVENPVIPVDAMNEYIDKEQDALELKKSRMVLGDSMRSAMKVQNAAKTKSVIKTGKPKSSSSSFATSVSMERAQTLNMLAICLFCAKEHLLDVCPQFKKKHKDKIIVQGHMSKTCNKRQICKVCSQKHPTVLHIEKVENPTTIGVPHPNHDKPSISSHACGHIGAGEEESVLSMYVCISGPWQFCHILHYRPHESA